MSPVLLTATALFFAGLALWFRIRGAWKGESGAYFICFLLSGALCAALTAASWWVAARTFSLALFMVSRIFYSLSAFSAFLFARSFATGGDHRIFFWSVPFQLTVAVILANGGGLYLREGQQWVADRGYPAFFINAAVILIYFLLAVYHIAALLVVLKREGRAQEAQRVLYFLAALLMLLYAGIMGSLLGVRTLFGRRFPLSELVYLVGVMVLSLAFRGWAGLGEKEEEPG